MGSALCAGSSRRGYALGHGFELANGLAAKEKRDERADRDNHENRAEEDRRRSDMRHHQKRRQHASEKLPERLAEGLPAAAQRRRELFREVDPGGGEGRQNCEAGDQRARKFRDREWINSKTV
jgi:hypothetical protein